MLTPDMEQSPLVSLTPLELTLVIATMHLHEHHDLQNVTFEVVFNEYHRFVSRQCPQLSRDREVMLKCWENLLHLEIIRLVGQTKLQVIKIIFVCLRSINKFIINNFRKNISPVY